jgi:hypothetical protein
VIAGADLDSIKVAIRVGLCRFRGEQKTMKKSRPEMLMEQFLENPPATPIKWMRFVRQKTQMELQVETGVNQSRISAFERGQLRPFTWERKALAKALNIDPDNLVFPTDEQAKTDK